FANRARINGILSCTHSNPCANLEALGEEISQSRRSPSPILEKNDCYTNAAKRTCNESTVRGLISGMLCKEYNEPGYQFCLDQAFTAFPKNVGFNNGLSAPVPDFVQGYEMEEFMPFPAQTQLNGAVLFKNNPYSLCLPHIAGECKGRGKNLEDASVQCAYDGAALTYARNQALAYMGITDRPGFAEVTTFATDGTTINFYAHYAVQSENGAPEYHQCLISSINLTKSFQDFKEGWKQLRNLQDRARNSSYALLHQLKSH
ncbi:hypothetical protein P885DRAFT_10642, partial [Corynascus similis CBS 632.67]